MSQMTTERLASTVKQGNESLRRVFAAYTISATAWLLFATFIGIVLAYKFGAPEFGPGEWLTFGRLRPIHTNGTFYGWASIALVRRSSLASGTLMRTAWGRFSSPPCSRTKDA